MKLNYFIILLIFINACNFKLGIEDPFRLAGGIVKVNFDIDDYENIKCKIKILENVSEYFAILHDQEFKYNLTMLYIIYDTLYAFGFMPRHEFDTHMIDVPILITVEKGNKEIYKNKFNVKFIAGIFEKNEIPVNYIGCIRLKNRD